MRRQLESRVDQIERFIARAHDKDVPDDVRAALARFGAVLVCGFVERSVEIIVTERLKYRAQDRVLNFIKTHFQRGTNYDCEAISQLLARFDPEWYRRFCAFVESNDDVREGISSAYGVRNSVAHGGSNSMGLNRLREIFEMSKQLVEGLVRATE
ncbi:HEPN domain-containing protein [Phenylobacterium sp.]|uniref:HEPN domain-containing protein n=1 Tax=Phenylobacterium sp. TaxID=1871053 RepID=UPI002B86A516|nr:HEPN domain-containing protein [Phenylobacterium sp.]HVI32671.1 HEPN domain-containing protein [Phenylobacterium sp.]